VSRPRPRDLPPLDRAGRLKPVGRLTLGVLAAGALAGCHLPVFPGCGPEENLPRNEIPFLYVGLAGDRPVAAVSLDQAGHSQFQGSYTVWMLSTPGSCQTIPTEDLTLLEERWQRVVEESHRTSSKLPERPYLRVAYWTEEGDHHLSPDFTFFIKPGRLDQSDELEQATAVTLEVLTRAYGDRFLRELHAAGLESLLRAPP
jgi:hypothetical protein